VSTLDTIVNKQEVARSALDDSDDDDDKDDGSSS
jgi:hypothetical protein